MSPFLVPPTPVKGGQKGGKSDRSLSLHTATHLGVVEFAGLLSREQPVEMSCTGKCFEVRQGGAHQFRNKLKRRTLPTPLTSTRTRCVAVLESSMQGHVAGDVLGNPCCFSKTLPQHARAFSSLLRFSSPTVLAKSTLMELLPQVWVPTLGDARLICTHHIRNVLWQLRW